MEPCLWSICYQAAHHWVKFLPWVVALLDHQEPWAYDWMQLGTLRIGAAIGLSADSPFVVGAEAVIRLGWVGSDAEGPIQSDLVMPPPYSSF